MDGCEDIFGCQRIISKLIVSVTYMCALILTSLSSSESSTDSLMLEDSDHTTPLKWNGGAVVRANFKWSAISALVKDVKEPVSTTTFTDTYLANILTSQLLLTSG